jgi:hypothetical protein
MAENISLVVSRPSSGLDLKVPVLVAEKLPTSIPANYIVIKVDRFGFSTNNVTYQALGEHPHFRYVAILHCYMASHFFFTPHLMVPYLV